MSANSFVIVSLDCNRALDKPFLDLFKNANRITSSAGLNGGFSVFLGHRNILNSNGISVGCNVSANEIKDNTELVFLTIRNFKNTQMGMTCLGVLKRTFFEERHCS